MAKLSWAAVGLCLLSVFSVPAAGADFVVKGIVVDSIDNQTIPFATVRVDRDGEEEAVSLSTSDADGAFRETLPAAGSYELTVSSSGKRSFRKAFSVDCLSPVVDFGRILMLSGVELQGVDVVAQKPLVKAEIDRIAYNVEEDPEAKSKSVIEMLRKIPMVTVDGQNNITVNGSSSFKVYVNGKPNSMMSKNPKEVLRSLPASSVKSIEVITDPGAKYDAEGVGGILNIITYGSQIQGYNLSVGATATNKGPSAYLYGTTQIGKFTVSGNYSYSDDDWASTRSEEDREDYAADGSVSRRLRTDRWYDSPKNTFHYGYLEGSYEHDTLNLLTFSAQFYKGLDNSRFSGATDVSDGAGNPIYSYRSAGLTETSFSSLGVNVDYQRSFKKKGELLTLSYRFDNSPNTSDSETGYSDAIEVPFSLRGQIQNDDARTGEHTVQIDYVNPITQKHYVDGGLKFIARKNTSDSQMYLEQPDGSFAYDTDGSSKYDQRQNILALYADYQLKLSKFGLKAGVRYEHTFMDVDYDLTPERNFDAGFDNAVPSATISYSLAPTSMLKLVYNMRLYRPGIWHLNPFRSSTNPNYVSYGNPDLDTEKGHNLSLNYSNFSQRLNMNLGLRYNFVNNGIEGYSFVDGAGVQNSTYGNIARRHVLTLAAWVNWNPTENTRFTVNFNGSYSDYRSDVIPDKNSGFAVNAYASYQQNLFWKIKGYLYGGGSTPRISLQGENVGYYFYGLTLNRSFLKEDRLEVSVFASDFFEADRTMTRKVVSESFRNTSVYHQKPYRFGVSVSWRFGSLNASVKKASRTISNDDVKQGEGGGQKGGQK